MKETKINEIKTWNDWCFDKGYCGADEDWILNILYASPEAIAEAGLTVNKNVKENQRDWICLPSYAEAASSAPEGYLPVAAYGGAYTDIMAADRDIRGYCTSTDSGHTFLVDGEGCNVDLYDLPDTWREEILYPNAEIYCAEDYESEDEDEDND